MSDVQALFSPLPDTIHAIQTTIGLARFNRYLIATAHNPVKALELYRWNSSLGESLHWPIQCLEVSLRNPISEALKKRIGADWHTLPSGRRVFSREDISKIEDAIARQRHDRKSRYVSADMVVADLPFGFWCSLLTAHYNVPLGWAKNLRVAFPHLPSGLVLQSVRRPMEDVRLLRNRVVHHEPIFNRRLDIGYRDILRLLGWICPATAWYVENTNSFPAIWAAYPT